MVWLDIGDPPAEIRRKIAGRFHARFPVGRGSLDDIVGIVQSKELLAPSLSGEPLDLKGILRPPLYLPEGTPALKALERFRLSPMHMALVVDEYGGFKGLVTLNDLLGSIVGELDAASEGQEPCVVRREDGTFLVDGMLPVDEFKEAFSIARLQGEEKGYFRTVGGFVMMQLGRVPKASDHFLGTASASRWWTWTGAAWTRCSWRRRWRPRTVKGPARDPPGETARDATERCRPHPPAWPGSLFRAKEGSTPRLTGPGRPSPPERYPRATRGTGLTPRLSSTSSRPRATRPCTA